MTQAEGLITGSTVKMFTIEPVIVCGTAGGVYGPVPAWYGKMRRQPGGCLRKSIVFCPGDGRSAYSV